MAGSEIIQPPPLDDPQKQKMTPISLREFPWWLVAIFSFLIIMAILIIRDPDVRHAFIYIFPGIKFTLLITLEGFALALVLGLLAGLGRINKNKIISNIAITYVEFIRGVPTLVLILTLSYVLVPAISSSIGFGGRAIATEFRAVISLAIIYGAFLAEVFRAGIESIPKGQMEAARSLGMTVQQSLRHIILPQAVRNISPALGNDFVAMLKDSSLASVLAIRELTQRSKLHAGSTFRFPEAYLVLTFFYLSMTLALSLLLRWYEGRLNKNAQ